MTASNIMKAVAPVVAFVLLSTYHTGKGSRLFLIPIGTNPGIQE